MSKPYLSKEGPVTGKQKLSQDEIKTMCLYHRVYRFMLYGGLRLTGLSLSIYSLIFGYWLSERSFFASNSSLAAFFCCERESVNRTLKKLMEQRLVERLSEREGNGAWHYTIVEATLEERVEGWGDILSQLRESVGYGASSDGSEGCDILSQVGDAREDGKAVAPGESGHRAGVMKSHISKGGNGASGVMKSHRGCDEKSQGGVMKNHIGCDKKSHRYNSLLERDKIGDNKACPLPSNCENDDECRRLWGIMLELPNWRNRPVEALQESVKIMQGYPVEVCREMLSHTVSGQYPMIYPPSKEIIEKCRERCDKKSHPVPVIDEKKDDRVISQLYRYFPHELKESIFNGPNGQRGLQFRLRSGQVNIICSQPVQDWLRSIKDILDSVLSDWVGSGYSGYSFVVRERN